MEQLESNVEASDLELSPAELSALTSAAVAFRPRSAAHTLLDSVGARARRVFGR
jgi:hypothetical protein